MRSLKAQRDRVVEWVIALSVREKAILAVAALMIVTYLSYLIIVPVRAAFVSQNDELARLSSELEGVDRVLDTYVKLKQRRDQIEQEYSDIEVKEGDLERIIREKIGTSTIPTIRAAEPEEFGGNFQQTSFKVSFQVTSVSSLVDLLKELVSGKSPVILTRFEMQRRPDRLDVEIEVSSIRRKSAAAAAA